MKLVNDVIVHTPDCNFQTKDGKRLRLRAAGIIIENGCVLAATTEAENYYYSVGGGIQFGETAEQAALREVLEETGVPYQVDRLAFVHENFFNRTDKQNNPICCHEITFYFLMKPRGTQELNSNSFTSGVKEQLVWLPIDKLGEYEVYPVFFKDKLAHLSPHIEHITTVRKD